MNNPEAQRRGQMLAMTAEDCLRPCKIASPAVSLYFALQLFALVIGCFYF
jgi:hypothetical protein